MPQSLSAVYIHLVFSTKNRQPFLRDLDIRTRLHAQLGGISKTLGCAPILTGGIEDHVHMLARLSRTITQAEWVKELKRVSNRWLKDEYQMRDFEWQVVMPISRLVNPIWSKSSSTLLIKNSITGR